MVQPNLDPDIAAERELVIALRAVRVPAGASWDKEVRSYLTPFLAFVETLFDNRARRISIALESQYEQDLKAAADRLIVQAIGHGPSVDITREPAEPRPEREPALVWELGSKAIYVEDEHGHRTPAPESAQAPYAPKCYWEQFMPDGMRFFIRSRDYPRVSEELTQALYRRRVYWLTMSGIAPASRPDVNGGLPNPSTSVDKDSQRLPKTNAEDRGLILHATSIDPAFWREKKPEFRRLQPPPPQHGEAAHDYDNGLCVWWNPDGWHDGKPYCFVNDGHDSEVKGNILRLFEIAAESAGVELGFEGDEVAIFGWLDHLRLEGVYVKPGVLPGTLFIHRVCDASAEYCVKCESAAKVNLKRLHSPDSTSLAPVPVNLMGPRGLLVAGAIVTPPPPDTSGVIPGWQPTILENEAAASAERIELGSDNPAKAEVERGLTLTDTSAGSSSVSTTPAGPIDRKGLYEAAKLRHPEWADRKFAQWCLDHGLKYSIFREWLTEKERADKPGKLKYPDGSPMAKKIVAALMAAQK